MSKISPKEIKHGVEIVPKLLPGGLLEPLGLLKVSWSAPGDLLERSWKPPEPEKILLGGSWPFQEKLSGRILRLGAFDSSGDALLRAGVRWGENTPSPTPSQTPPQ